MNKVKSMMKQAHAQSQSLTESPVKINIKSAPETPRPMAPPAQPPVRTMKDYSDIKHTFPTGVAQIARDDVPVNSYGVKPVATNFNCYNKELFEWLKTFSSNNQFSGGVPITKSQLIEVMLDVMYYDLGINPIGYESQQALREDIQNKVRGIV